MPRKLPTIQVIDRASRLLDAIGRYPQPVTLKVLSIETELHPATAFRILGSMTTNGLVERDDRGHYTLGIRFRLAGDGIHGDARLRREAHDTLIQLHTTLSETVDLSLRDGSHLTYIERIDAGDDRRAVIGKYAPLHATACGKLFLGHEGEAYCREYANSTVFAPVTDKTITSHEALQEAVRMAMQIGHGVDAEESEIGRGCVGVLVTNAAGTAVAGLSVSMAASKLADAAHKQRCVDELIKAARHLKSRLGFAETAAA